MPRPPAKRPIGYAGSAWREIGAIVAIIAAALVVAAVLAVGICDASRRPCGPSLGIDPPGKR